MSAALVLSWREGVTAAAAGAGALVVQGPGGRASQPSRTGTSYSRPGANRGQKCRSPGTITLATGKPTSGRVWSRISSSIPACSTSA